MLWFIISMILLLVGAGLPDSFIALAGKEVA